MIIRLDGNSKLDISSQARIEARWHSVRSALMESERAMSEASSKQAIELGTLVSEKGRVSENILDLLKEIAGGNSRDEGSNGLSSGSSAVNVQLEKTRYAENDSRRYVGQVLVYSCASPAVLAILQTLSDMFA